MTAEPVLLPTADGLQLAGTYHPPPAGQDSGLRLQINGATAVPQKYYHRFAAHLRQCGIGVLTYDYRCIGASPQVPGATMLDWGLLDAPAATQWLRQREPAARLAVLGHSFGGQILGLTPEAARYNAVFLVGSQSGYWRHWPGFARWKLWAVWHLLLPGCALLLGHVPGRITGGTALPAGIARDWARMCRAPDYLVDPDGQPLRPHTHLLRVPVLSYGFTDDTLAPEAAMRALHGFYPAAAISHHQVAPQAWGLRRIGHFGFFGSAMPPQRWDEVAAWLLRASEATEKAA